MNNSKRAFGTLFFVVLIVTLFRVPFSYVNSTMSLGAGGNEIYNWARNSVLHDGMAGDHLLINGSGVVSGGIIFIYWDQVSDWNETDANGLIANTEAASDGTFETKVIVPSCEGGAHYIWIEDVEGNTFQSSGLFTVTPKILLNIEQGVPDDSVTVTGSGFTKSERIQLSIQNATTEMNLTSIGNKTTNSLGSFSLSFRIPDWDYGQYEIKAIDESGLQDDASIDLNPIITLSIAEGSVGNVITVFGKGFDSYVKINKSNVGWDFKQKASLVNDDVLVNSNGEFSLRMIIPSSSVGTHEINVSDGINSAISNFKITEDSILSLSYFHSLPGSNVTVSGENFPSIGGTEVDLYLNNSLNVNIFVGRSYTETNGSFIKTFIVPAVAFGNYSITAITSKGVNEVSSFIVGSLIVLSKTTGPSGTIIGVSGFGLSGGAYNLTFGIKQLITNEPIGWGQISNSITIPTIEPGIYDVLIDTNLITLSTQFNVTETTHLTLTPSKTSDGYNVTLHGDHYSETSGVGIQWSVSNSTWTSEQTIMNASTLANVTTTQFGNFTGYWIVPSFLRLGNQYTITATDSGGLFAETTITICEEVVDVNPKKVYYRLGDTITFSIRTTFPKVGSVLSIIDPDGSLYYESTFLNWTNMDSWKIIQINIQVDDINGYPYRIPRDANTGNWTWTYRENNSTNSEVFAAGILEVHQTIEDQVDSRFSMIAYGIDNLTLGMISDLEYMRSGLVDDIKTLSLDLGGVSAMFEILKNGTISDLENDISAATVAANNIEVVVGIFNNTLGKLPDSISVVTDAVNNAKDATDTVADAAIIAASLAEAANRDTQWLTIMILTFIGISFFSALAALSIIYAMDIV